MAKRTQHAMGACTDMKVRHMKSFKQSRQRLPAHRVQEQRANAQRLAKQRKDEMDY